ncbi:MAG: PepSY domain-containing protein, partial [Tissierellia bacterium]|nr:PepSY domain-containing protein [Tissierellia bacterium]
MLSCLNFPYYHLVFDDTQTRWTYRIDAVLGIVLEKNKENIDIVEFISLEKAKAIALNDAGLENADMKIVFTKEELNRNQGTPCYLLEFYTSKYQYYYKIDAKTGSILDGGHYILLTNAKKIAINDA